MLNIRDPVGVELHRSLTALDLAALDGWARVMKRNQRREEAAANFGR